MLQQIARALRISAEQLYVRAGIVSPDDGVGGSVEIAVLSDTGLSERQKLSLLDVYSSFIAMNDVERTEAQRVDLDIDTQNDGSDVDQHGTTQPTSPAPQLKEN